MALPKAARLVALATMAVFCFLVIKIFRAPSAAQSADSKTATKFDDMTRDPQLDGMALARPVYRNMADYGWQQLGSLPSPYGELRATITLRTTQIQLASTRQSCHLYAMRSWEEYCSQ